MINTESLIMKSSPVEIRIQR